MEATATNQRTLDRAQSEIADQTTSNPFANIWLLFLATLLGGTLFCTLVLVAWPIIAKMVAG